MAAMKGELEQKDDAYARAHDDLCAAHALALPCPPPPSSQLPPPNPPRYEAACALEDDMSAVYRMLSQLASYDAGATVTAPEYE